jgi:hypothetical protein
VLLCCANANSETRECRCRVPTRTSAPLGNNTVRRLVLSTDMVRLWSRNPLGFSRMGMVCSDVRAPFQLLRWSFPRYSCTALASLASKKHNKRQAGNSAHAWTTRILPASLLCVLTERLQILTINSTATYTCTCSDLPWQRG